jgi:hypothetical protein
LPRLAEPIFLLYFGAKIFPPKNGGKIQDGEKCFGQVGIESLANPSSTFFTSSPRFKVSKTFRIIVSTFL